jgi:hypothetical protein
MKRASIIFLAAVLTLSFAVAVDADAGWFGKDKKENETKDPHRFDRYPSMDFHRGVLKRDHRTGWRLDGLTLQFMSECEVTVDGSDKGDLQEGRSAIVTGPRWGNTIVAWRVRVMNNKPSYGNYDSDIELKQGASPYVSQGNGPE